jgi:choline dehydrogenase-like flavoprotein
MANEGQVSFPINEPVDFVIIGSGAAGGILAKELSTNGFKVVVLEQGPYRKASDFTHDELAAFVLDEWTGGNQTHQQTVRSDESEEAKIGQSPAAYYGMMVGGSSVLFSANFWRFREIDFNERSVLGPISGTSFADWPISYAELEPYYTKVDWEVGVSGAPGPNDAFRSKPFPMPPMPINSSGVLLQRAAKKLGISSQVEPLAILSQPHNGRPGCINCGFCSLFGCEVGAKSSSLASMIPLAEASGNCEIRAECAAFRIGTNAEGRADEVLYYDPDGNERSQKTRAVIVSANGAETPRLLLNSANAAQPDGLANSSGFVGRNLMFNTYAGANALFEHPLNDFKGVQVTRVSHEYYESDPSRGFYGGGGIDARSGFASTPMAFAAFGTEPSAPTWGAEYKANLAHNFAHSMNMSCDGTSLAQDSNNITIDPTAKDRWGRPSIRVTYKEHDDDVALKKFMQDRALEFLDAAGAVKSWSSSFDSDIGGVHLLGTCRMGDDPQASVIDKFHRTHEVPNLFLCDGSSFVTSGRGQPTMTIMALAFRAAEHIGAAARNNNI